MTFELAKYLMENGEKVKLPEWTGYWFMEDGKVLVSTKEGDVTDTPFLDDYSNRTDWEITDGLRDFGGAIKALKAGKKVTRKGWNGKFMWLALQTPDVDSKMSLPYIYMKTLDNKLIPWLASQTDVLSEDWEIL